MTAPSARVRSGPLCDLRVVEFEGVGPAPFCGMLLSDLGADVIRIDRSSAGDLVGADIPARFNTLGRGRRSVAFDLKRQDAVTACLKLVDQADVLIEGFRPGVMERLGLGPDVCSARNPKLVYGRVTGWGQYGPNALRAGHDLNYIALSGALHAIGTQQQPVPPLNLVGDFGGGALYLAFGVLAALIHARRTGLGQVVDCAMSDGAASLMGSIYAVNAAGQWLDRRQENLIDGGAHFYGVYRCADGKWVSVAALERRFYAELVQRTGLDDPNLEAHEDRSRWPGMRLKLAAIIASKTQPEWCRLMDGTDACFAPVRDLSSAPLDPHNAARQAFIELEGVVQPAPAPRFEMTPGQVQGPPPERGQHSRETLNDWGLSAGEIDRLIDSGACR